MRKPLIPAGPAASAPGRLFCADLNEADQLVAWLAVRGVPVLAQSADARPEVRLDRDQDAANALFDEFRREQAASRLQRRGFWCKR